MGAWSHEPFGNDTANDWAHGLEGSTNLTYVEKALDKAVEAGEDTLDASDAEEAVAAAEVIAKLLGRGTQSDSYTEKIDRWVRDVSARPNPALTNKARRALQRVLADNSELKALWEDSDSAAEWHEGMARLRAALVT